VRKSHHLLAASWGQADQDAWCEKEGKDNKEDKHNKVHLLYTNLFFICGPSTNFAYVEKAPVKNNSSHVLVLVLGLN
jgi:hypothetical protein